MSADKDTSGNKQHGNIPMEGGPSEDAIEECIEHIRVFTLAAVKKPRYEHSLRVAETASCLAAKYGVFSPRLAYLAGVGHDMCKDMDEDVLLSLAARDGEAIEDIEREKPSLLHGRAAAVKLRRDFGLNSPFFDDVIEAVAVHTFGKERMSDLSKVLYIADKIEPGRSFVDRKYIQSIQELSLMELLLKVTLENVKYLRKKGEERSQMYAVSPKTLELLSFLKDEGVVPPPLV